MHDRFRPGQTVRLCPGLQRFAAAGAYKIVRALPQSSGEREYRVKSLNEPHERVVRESDLEKA